ncbi:MAG: chemotaxis protein CheA [Candidatus Omnitrophica bacterium]|nr:chemotaxis protein CheA [Candidatus Omnitrophota bacterium]
MQNSYRELFLSESQEYLANISKCLVRLEKDPSDQSAINEIFRGMHTLKGMSATMGFEKLTQLAHQMEDLLDELRNRRKQLTSAIIDTLFAAVDVVEQLLDEIKENKSSTTDIIPIIETIQRHLSEKEVISLKENQTQPQTINIQEKQDFPFNSEEVSRLKTFLSQGNFLFHIFVHLNKDCVMKEARAFLIVTALKRLGEIIKAIPSIEDLKEGKFDLSFELFLVSKEEQRVIRQEMANISEIEGVRVTPVSLPKEMVSQQQEVSQKTSVGAQPSPVYVKKIQSMRIPVERLDKIMNLMGELAIAKIRLAQIVQTYKIEPLEEVVFLLDRLISTLQDEVMQTRLLPVAYILDAFPRVVRDLAHKQNKDIDFSIVGGDIELDRVVLDEISDPLLHLVRNAIDHGIEDPQTRKKAGKNPRGRIVITVSRQKGQIFIEISDDGKGIDFKAVRKKALEKGLITEEEAKELDEKKVFDLITLPGFSTSEKVTDISGRGVGLDVVKSKIESLGGRVDFETKPGQGSRFILTLPLTLAIIKAMLVNVHHEVYAIPLMNIRETIKVHKRELKYVQNFEVMKVREEVVPIIRLDRTLGIVGSSTMEDEEGRLSLVIVEYGKKALGLVVSSVIGEQDIAVKPLGSWVKRTKGVAGATILGDGRVALILDIMSLM